MSDEIGTEVLIDGERISLSQIGDVDMAGVEAVRFSNLPKGLFRFQITEPGEFLVVGEGDEQYARIVLKMKVIECIAMLDPKKDSVDEVIDKTHTEMFNLKTSDAIGRYAAFLEDSGYTGGGSLQESLVQLEDHTFKAKIRHTKSKANSDVTFANLDFNKVKQTDE